MNSFLRRGWWWPRRMSTCPSTRSWQTRMCPIFMSWKPCSLSSHEATWRNSLPGDTSTGTSPTRASSISVITSTCPLRLCPPPCDAAVLRLAGHGPKVWRESDLQDSREGKPTETPTDKVPCPLVPTRKPRLGLGQRLNSSLEADLVVDMVSHLSKVVWSCFVLNKPVKRKN